MNHLETYLRELRAIKASGAATKETSLYPALLNLLNAVGKDKALQPRVRCVLTPKSKGAGIPDLGLFTARQLQRVKDDAQLLNLPPERGVLEVKGTNANVAKIAETEQVAKYLKQYGQVLVTNYRDFLLVSRDAAGQNSTLEAFHLADSETAFWQAPVETISQAKAERFVEYLKRVMLHNAPLDKPADVAWFLASYARDAKARIEGEGLGALKVIRDALEEALGVKFEGEKGERFFRSTLVQTLFYGVFSAWVLWHKQNPKKKGFDWYSSARYLRVPVLRKLFHLISEPGQMDELQLSETLDWAAAALNRVNRAAFFASFNEGEAVQYFYEPFLEAFDPQLRKELGVWYTPSEIVQYMVARVDTVLRTELGIADGLADERVYVLDPCCGTGAYLVEVLKRIHQTLQERGGDALSANDLKKAATERVFGFEILPAPFVVAHLQLGLLLQTLDAPLADKAHERAQVYLTNALTGWEPPKGPKKQLLFAEMEEERDAAETIKRDKPILVVLGNPPYNGYAGLAVSEERALTDAYRTTKRAPAPEGQGLNDLYVRFFRMAERRIVELSKEGVVCFISNYSWLDGLSFTGMREKYLESFDRIWIDCLNGDKYKTGKLTPEGAPDPSVFSTEWNREGIQVGTAIGLLVRKTQHQESEALRFRHLWGKNKRQELLESAGHDGSSHYQCVAPLSELGLPFAPMQVGEGYSSWPLLPELLPWCSSGVNTSRDIDLVEIDQDKLDQRMRMYFDTSRNHAEVKQIAPSLMLSSARYDAEGTRQYLMQRGINSGYFVRYCYRPFDSRHVYWHPETKLLDEKRDDLFTAFNTGNWFLTSRQKAERQNEGTPFYVTRNLPDRHLTRPGSNCFPLTTKGLTPHKRDLFDQSPEDRLSNLSEAARGYLALLGIANPDVNVDSAGLIWMHTLAIGYSPAYLQENADGIKQDWPRIPLPATREALLASAELGRQIAALLDTETPVPGVTTGTLRPELRAIADITRAGGGKLHPEDGELDVTAGWGHAGKGGITMPGKGKLVERDYTAEEQTALGEAAALLGATTNDIYLNAVAYWRNVPARVWDYTIGGYQVMKKWLSYRERPLLGRGLKPEEVREVTQMARRIAAILLLEPELDENYRRVKGMSYEWR
ncbi:MAG: type ISP restriction/modification enzyme [Blastocatellales bacterium]